MNFTKFFKLSWSIQLIVGIAFFSASLIIEGLVLQSMLAIPLLAWFIAIVLELGKAAAIVWHRYLVVQVETPYPGSTRFASASFRLGLLFVSTVCSLMFFTSYAAGHTDGDLTVGTTALVHTTEAVLGLALEPLEFAFYFAVVFALILELGILLAFEVVTVTMLPALQVQHSQEVASEVMRAKVSGESARDHIVHASVLKKVRKSAQSTLAEAQGSLPVQRKKGARLS